MNRSALSRSPSQQALGLLGWLALTTIAAAIGAFASVNAREFYEQLARPGWAPPAWLFGPVWTLLYALMALILWALIVATVVSFQRLDRIAAYLLYPYLAWTTFACALTLAVWRLNPGLLS